MEGYKKTILENHKGEKILPLTTSSMVSEESDRRFVDNIEKEVLNKIATEENAIDGLIKNYQSLSALASEEIGLLNLLDTVPSDLNEWGILLDSLSTLEPFKDELISLIGASPEVLSETTGHTYSIQVNDENELNPFLYLKKIDSTISQPEGYLEGDRWYVPLNALDVELNIPVSKIVFDNTKKTILTLQEGLDKAGVSEDILQNIINGAQKEGIKSTGEMIPQAFVEFDVNQYLEEVLPNITDNKVIKRFAVEILGQPIGAGTIGKTQMYLAGNVVQPTREFIKQADYTTNSFTHLTWQTSMDSIFAKDSFLNKVGVAAINAYGVANSSINISKPALKIHIENPYKGKTLVAKKSQEGNFNILDWTVVE